MWQKERTIPILKIYGFFFREPWNCKKIGRVSSAQEIEGEEERTSLEAAIKLLKWKFLAELGRSSFSYSCEVKQGKEVEREEKKKILQFYVFIHLPLSAHNNMCVRTKKKIWRPAVTLNMPLQK